MRSAPPPAPRLAMNDLRGRVGDTIAMGAAITATRGSTPPEEGRAALWTELDHARSTRHRTGHQSMAGQHAVFIDGSANCRWRADA